MTKHIVLVVDRSGSMRVIADDMNGGINTWLSDIVATDPDAQVTSILFDDQFEATNERKAAAKVKPSSLRIVPRGSTALNDAIMRGLSTIKDGEDALVMIVTDGYENASREVTTKEVKARIAELEEQGVVFNYLSASPTAFADATAYGFRGDQTIAYTANTEGSVVATSNLRQSSSAYLNYGKTTNNTAAK